MKKTFYLCLALAILLSLSACGLSGGPIDGRILDMDTRKPIPNAIVVVLWHGTDRIPPADTRSSCYHAESAVTDTEGRYKIAHWTAPSEGPLFSEDYVRFVVHKPGYEQNMEYRYSPSEDTKKNIYFLKEFKGSQEARLKYLSSVSINGDCSSAGKSRRNLYPLFETLYYEVKALGTNQEELLWYKRWAARMAVAEDGNRLSGETERKIDEFLLENLK